MDHAVAADYVSAGEGCVYLVEEDLSGEEDPLFEGGLLEEDLLKEGLLGEEGLVLGEDPVLGKCCASAVVASCALVVEEDPVQ